jgi:membrane-associated phospholipid phosphatase
MKNRFFGPSFALAAAIALAACPSPARAQVTEEGTPAPPSPDGMPEGKEVAPKVEEPSVGPVKKAIRAVTHEAGRYVSDSFGFLTAPAHWRPLDWQRAAGVTLVLGGLFAADREIDRAAQRNRSNSTDRLASATTRLGSGLGTELSFSAVGFGLVFHNDRIRDMGREALEASLLTAFVDNLVIKRTFGRERPNRSDGKTDFDFGSNNSSFPSGHATQAFAIASVVAARSKGWVVPTLAYTAASLVAFDRVNDHVHFASDVFAGAVFGTVAGRFLVHKHDREAVGEPSKTRLDIVPIPHGLGARLAF